MATAVTALHPDVEDVAFDVEDDLTRHMPEVADRFGLHGAAGWRAVRPDGTPADSSPFGVTATPELGGADGLGAADAAEGSAVFGDVPNSSDEQPRAMVGEGTGHG